MYLGIGKSHREYVKLCFEGEEDGTVVATLVQAAAALVQAAVAEKLMIA